MVGCRRHRKPRHRFPTIHCTSFLFCILMMKPLVAPRPNRKRSGYPAVRPNQKLAKATYYPRSPCKSRTTRPLLCQHQIPPWQFEQLSPFPPAMVPHFPNCITTFHDHGSIVTHSDNSQTCCGWLYFVSRQHVNDCPWFLKVDDAERFRAESHELNQISADFAAFDDFPSYKGDPSPVRRNNGTRKAVKVDRVDLLDLSGRSRHPNIEFLADARFTHQQMDIPARSLASLYCGYT